MIRYIDIGDQITDGSSQFAWCDTVRGQFLEFNESQTWDTWKGFEDDFWSEVKRWGGFRLRKDDKAAFIIPNPKEYLARFKRPYPLNLKRDNPAEKELILEED